MCWDGGEKGGAWHLRALLMLRCERPIRMSGAVKGNLKLTNKFYKQFLIK
jgi:hypothetical protein